eukprot:scaffold139_cov324-Prasinococcus_capsulatus_cf.AAC.5
MHRRRSGDSSARTRPYTASCSTGLSCTIQIMGPVIAAVRHQDLWTASTVQATGKQATAGGHGTSQTFIRTSTMILDNGPEGPLGTSTTTRSQSTLVTPALGLIKALGHQQAPLALTCRHMRISAQDPRLGFIKQELQKRRQAVYVQATYRILAAARHISLTSQGRLEMCGTALAAERRELQGRWELTSLSQLYSASSSDSKSDSSGYARGARHDSNLVRQARRKSGRSSGLGELRESLRETAEWIRRHFRWVHVAWLVVAIGAGRNLMHLWLMQPASSTSN